MRSVFPLQLGIILATALVWYPAHAQSAAPVPAPWQDHAPKLKADLIDPRPLGEVASIIEQKPPVALSPLEEMYSGRVVDQLSQFGLRQGEQ